MASPVLASAPKSAPRSVPGVGLSFVLRGLVVMGTFLAFYYYPHSEQGMVARFLAWYLSVQARVSGAVIVLFDPTVHVEGTLIAGSYPLRIVKTCSALDVQALFAAAVLAFPARLRIKAIGLVSGFLVLYLLNALRVVALYSVGVHRPDWFDTVHEEFMPLALVCLTCLAFLVWSREAVRAR